MLNSDFYLLGLFLGEMGVAPMPVPKKLAYWVDILDQLLSRKHVTIFRPEPPLAESVLQKKFMPQLLYVESQYYYNI